MRETVCIFRYLLGQICKEYGDSYHHSPGRCRTCGVKVPWLTFWAPLSHFLIFPFSLCLGAPSISLSRQPWTIVLEIFLWKTLLSSGPNDNSGIVVFLDCRSEFLSAIVSDAFLFLNQLTSSYFLQWILWFTSHNMICIICSSKWTLLIHPADFWPWTMISN